MKISSHILKISGVAELPQELMLSTNYDVSIKGTVVKTEDVDNHDGSFDRKYTIKPILVELVSQRGESIKSKDTRSESQLFRAIIKKKYIELGIAESFDDFYTKVYRHLYPYLDAIVADIHHESNQ